MVMKVLNIWVLGANTQVTRCDYKVYKSEPYVDANLIYSYSKTEGDILEHHDIIRNSDGTIYPPQLGSKAIARVWYGDVKSGWFELDGGTCMYSKETNEGLLHTLTLNKDILTGITPSAVVRNKT